MRIACIYPPRPYLVNPDAQVGLGLLMLATLARDLGADVEVLDWQSLSEPPEMMGQYGAALITGCTVDEPMAVRVARTARQSGCRYVVLGGPVADHEKWLSGAAPFDAVVQGPGEPFVESLVQSGEQHGLFCYSENRIAAMGYDRWPPPDRRLLDGRLGGNIFHPDSGHRAERSATLLTARGCRYRCAFCRSGGTRGRYEYDIDRVEEEVEQIVSLGIRYVRIADDNLLLNLTRLPLLCDLLRRWGIVWRASARTRPAPADALRLMAESGCVEVSFGVESADQQVLDALDKGAKVEYAHEAVEACRAAGMHARALFMMGTPSETPETLELNKRWAAEHSKTIVCLTAFVPFPGTAIWRDPRQFGVRLEPQWENASFYAFRGDGSEPEAHLSIIDGLSRAELTANLRAFRAFLQDRGQINRGE